MKPFLLNLCVITAIAGAATYILSNYFLQLDFFLSTALCIFFFVITAITHFFLTKQKQKTFVNRFMLITVSKFLISVFLLLGYAFARPNQAIPFIVLFATYYLIFGAFEVGSLFVFFKQKK